MAAAFLALALLAAPLSGEDLYLEVPKAHRVKNQPSRLGVGLCWFSAAETAGRHAKIRPLRGLVERLRSDPDPVGQLGADPKDVWHWETKLDVVGRHNPHGKTPGGLSFIRRQLKEGLPVVVCLEDWPTHPALPRKLPASPEEAKAYSAKMRELGLRLDDYLYWHSVLLVGETLHRWKDGTVSRAVWVVDSNEPDKVKGYELAWFERVWLGRAVAYSPADQKE